MTTVARPPLLETKLRAPERRAGLVARPGLAGRLDRAVADHRLTLVSAAAGWGKSTLVGEWLAGLERPCAWLALDASDNDPARFWRYVAEALQRAGVPVDEGALGTLAAGGDLREAGLAALLSAADEADDGAVVALDDLHLVTEPSIHEALEWLVPRLPERLRLVVTSRNDPPIGLARLRARGDLAEIRSDDLRFGDDDAAVLLSRALGRDLAAGQVAALRARTEGWAAGLYLAGLSLRGRDDAEAFIADFAGDDRLVVDYLAAEVLETATPARRDFLLRTSVLGRLSGPLCDAVAGVEGSARVLEELERSNLFLVPLDNRREWYRYHHLFGELLRHELALSGEDPGGLHRRASAWHLEAGDIDEAIHHAAAGDDLDTAADLIARHWADYERSGWTATTEAWLALLPASRVRADPRLCLAEALIRCNLGRPAEAAPWIVAAEAAAAAPGAPGEPPLIAGGIASARSLERLLSGDGPAAVAHGREALALTPADRSWWRALACMALGIALHGGGEPEEAYPVLEEAVDAARTSGALVLAIVALSHLSDTDFRRGELDRAETRAREAIALAEDERHSEYPHAAGAHANLARALAARGETPEAVENAERAVQLARRGHSATETAYVLVQQGEVLLATGDREGARGAVAGARALLEGAREANHICAILDDLAARAAGPEPASAPPPAAAEGSDLTDRELAVLRRLTGDGSAREIAADLYVSHNTVKTQMRSIYRKLGAATREEAVRRARERGLLPRSLAAGAGERG